MLSVLAPSPADGQNNLGRRMGVCEEELSFQRARESQSSALAQHNAWPVKLRESVEQP